MKREVSWSGVAVVAAAVAVTVVCGYLLASWPPAPPPAPAAAAPHRPATPTASPSSSPSPSPSASAEAGDTPVVAVLGDSFTAKSQASNGPPWPQLLARSLGWKAFANAVDGSGYLAPGSSRPFPQRVPAVLGRSPDVVVVAGGFHDVRAYGVPQISEAADRLLTRLSKTRGREVVVLSPFSAGAPGPLTVQLSASLRQVAERHHVEYVDATGWLPAGEGLVAADGIHPTEQGQRRIAARMEQALKRLGVVKAAGQPTH